MGMMDRPGDSPTDPQAWEQWLQLQGELPKAMGEVLMKHGQARKGEQ
jgi:hypothetical protein